MTEENGTNNTESTQESLIAPYLIDADELRKTVQELGQKLATADEHNEKVKFMYDSLMAGDVKEEAIKAALDAQFGKPKAPRKPRSPNRTDKTPTDIERKILDVMTTEGMSKKEIFSAAGLTSKDENGKDTLAGMARMEWIKNAGSKGRGASWVLTEAGQAIVSAE